MANTTFNGPVRSENGFESITKDASTGIATKHADLHQSTGGNSVTADAAKKAGADDAWMVQDGHVTEGTSNNAYIIKGHQIITRGLSNDILHGITRAAVLRCAEEAQMEVIERPFSIAEAQEADEAFITSASTFVMPVVTLDDRELGSGQPGPVAARLREIYLEESLKQAI